jgi:hypothetical protein
MDRMNRIKRNAERGSVSDELKDKRLSVFHSAFTLLRSCFLPILSIMSIPVNFPVCQSRVA